MATDVDILKTLQSINALLKGASVLSESNRLNSADRSKQTASQKSGKDAKKTYQATADRAKELGNTIVGLNKSLFGLNTQVGNVTTSFGSLHSQMSKFMSSLTPITMPDSAAGVASPSDRISDRLLGAALESNQLATKSFNQAASIGNLANSYLKVIAGASVIGAAAEVGSMPSLNQQGAAMVGQIGTGITKGTKATVKDVENLNIPFKAQIGRMIQDFGKTSSALGGLGIAASNVKDIFKKLTGDYFGLAAAGMGTMSNLMQLSKQAFMSGMSLKEYQAVIRDNITVASRSGSLENFNKIISAADGQLNSMGIFGMEARQMQASLADSSTMMGIKQNKLTDVIAAQISVFDDLRKSTNMTADEFAGLVKDLSKNEKVQRELIGLAPRERIARQQEFLQIAAIGPKLGLAGEASKKLADALIAQRSETVKGRIDQAGRVRQLGQLTGRGAEGERAAQIIMKGRRASAAETKELAGLAVSLKAASESAYEGGSLGMQGALDFFGENMGTFGKLMEAAVPAGLAEDSGKVNQEAFGRHVSGFGQFVGELLKWGRGFNESFGPMIIGAIGGIGLALFKGPIIKALSMVAGKFGIGVAGAAGAAGTTAASAAAGPGMLAKAGQGVASIIQGVKGIPSAVASIGPSIMSSVRVMRAGVAAAVEMSGPGRAAIMGLQSVGKGLLNGAASMRSGLAIAANTAGRLPLIGGIIGAVFEAFTGDIANALNPNAGIFERIGGVITGFFTALPQFIIDTLGFVFGPNLKATLQNGFDQFVALANGAIKWLFGKIFKVLGGALSWILPDDSPLVLGLKKWGEETGKSADETLKVANELANDHGKTLSSIGADNKAKAELAEKAAKGTKDATTKATVAQKDFNNVQLGLATSQASMIADARGVIQGTPGVQVPNAVKPVAVNTPDAATANTAKTAEAGTQTQTSAELLVALNSILGVMRASLTQEQRQVELAELMIRGNRPMATFTPAEATVSKLFGMPGMSANPAA